MMKFNQSYNLAQVLTPIMMGLNLNAVTKKEIKYTTEIKTPKGNWLVVTGIEDDEPYFKALPKDIPFSDLKNLVLGFKNNAVLNDCFDISTEGLFLKGDASDFIGQDMRKRNSVMMWFKKQLLK